MSVYDPTQARLDAINSASMVIASMVGQGFYAGKLPGDAAEDVLYMAQRFLDFAQPLKAFTLRED